MIFLPPRKYQPAANRLFDELKIKIEKAVPYAKVEHIGSSSIAGAVSKGDLDIYAGVETARMNETIPRIEALGFKIKSDSCRTAELCPFEARGHAIDVGLQLVARGSRFEFFLKFRDTMNSNKKLREEYNLLKRDSAGLNQEDYRKIKSVFIERVLSGNS